MSQSGRLGQQVDRAKVAHQLLPGGTGAVPSHFIQGRHGGRPSSEDAKQAIAFAGVRR